MSQEIEIPVAVAALAKALVDADDQRREREAKRELARLEREEREERRRANPPLPVATLLETYRGWHAAAMTLPWLREQVADRPMSIIPYGLEGVQLGPYTLGPPWVVDGRAEATLEIQRSPELRFSYWRVGYLAAMSGGRNLTALDSLGSFSPESLDALTRYFEAGVWADLERKLERLVGRTATKKTNRD